MDLKRKIIETGKSIKRNITFPLSDGDLIYDVFGEPLMKDGKITGASTASTDITHLLKKQALEE